VAGSIENSIAYGASHTYDGKFANSFYAEGVVIGVVLINKFYGYDRDVGVDGHLAVGQQGVGVALQIGATTAKAHHLGPIISLLIPFWQGTICDFRNVLA
jgi:hypothetical protein